MILMVAAVAAALSPDSAIGRWKTETRNGIVDIAPCGASLCGTLTSSDGIRANPDLRDIKNKDAGLRGRRVQGIAMLSGFARGDGGWTGGSIYNASDGGTYRATLTPIDAEHLRVKGCWFVLCQNQTWTRVR